MALSTRTLLLLVLGVSLAICFIPTARSLVFGLDFGSRWVKMSVIRGNTFEIILDAQTKRKFMSGLAFHDDERFFAADAEKVMPRSPQHTYQYLSQLLGKSHNSSVVEALKPHLLYADEIVPNGERGTVAIRYNENTTFAVEDLAGMVFNFARETALAYVQSPVADVVITVPPHWTAEERAAVIEAAELGGFHVLSLINDGTAIALHYAFGKRFEEPKNVIFYDMGHSNTRATLVEYHSIRIKKGAKNVTQPTMKVKAVAYDTSLGGRDFDYRLAEHLAGVAVTQMAAKGIKSSVDEIKANKRAWARLMTAASQAKTVLSANMETYAAVEGLVGSYDLKTTVSRAQFEEMCEDLFARATTPVKEVLAAANMTVEEVGSMEVVGGSVRIPKVQAVLKETLGLPELSKTLNGDEAAVLGAVFYAAHLSTSIKVPEHKIKDITPYGVTATIKLTRPADALEASDKEDSVAGNQEGKGDDDDDDDDDIDEEAEDETGTVTKVLSLFKPFGRVGAKKNVSFKKNVSNFTVELAYDDEAKLPEDAPRQLARFTVEDMNKLKKYNYTGKPKVTLAFRLTTSGLVELETAEAEVVVIKYPEPEPSAKSTPAPTTAPEATEEAAADEATGEEKEDSATNKEDEEAEKEEVAADDEEAEEESKKQEKDEPKKEKKPKKTVHKVALGVVTQKLGIPERTYVEKSRARALLRQWEAKAASKREKADAKNDLETYIYDIKEKLWDDELEKVSTEEQREEAREALSAAADWLEDEGIDVSVQEYKDKKAELVKLASAIFERKEELTKRPVQVAMLSYMLNHSRSSLVGITERLKVEVEERDEVLDLIEETEDWLKSKVKEQEGKEPHEEPAFKSEQVQAKASVIEKTVRKLLKRKPRPTPSPATSSWPYTAAGDDDDINKAAEETTETREEAGDRVQEEVVPPKEEAGEDIL